MKTLKKTLCLVLAVVMAVGVLVIPANAATIDDFADEDIKHPEAVAVLTGMGIISGKDNGKFDPTGNLSRNQAAKIVAYAIAGSTLAESLDKTEKLFDDVPAGGSYTGYINFLKTNNVISGDAGSNNYMPTSSLTGYQLGKMMLVAAGIGVSADYEGSGWKTKVAVALNSNGLLTGLTGLDLNKAINRDDACQLLFNVMTKTVTTGSLGGNLYVDEDGNLKVRPNSSTSGSLYGDVYDGHVTVGVVTANQSTGAEYTDIMAYNANTKTLGATASYDVETNLDLVGHVVKAYHTSTGAVYALIDQSTVVPVTGSTNVGETFKNVDTTVSGLTFENYVPGATAAVITPSTTLTGDYVLYGSTLLAVVKTPTTARLLSKVLDYTAAIGNEPAKVQIAGVATGTTLGATAFVKVTDINAYEGIAKNDYVYVTKTGSTAKLVVEKATVLEAQTATARNQSGSKISLNGVEYNATDAAATTGSTVTVGATFNLSLPSTVTLGVQYNAVLTAGGAIAGVEPYTPTSQADNFAVVQAVFVAPATAAAGSTTPGWAGGTAGGIESAAVAKVLLALADGTSVSYDIKLTDAQKASTTLTAADVVIGKNAGADVKLSTLEKGDVIKYTVADNVVTTIVEQSFVRGASITKGSALIGGAESPAYLNNNTVFIYWSTANKANSTEPDYAAVTRFVGYTNVVSKSGTVKAVVDGSKNVLFAFVDSVATVTETKSLIAYIPTMAYTSRLDGSNVVYDYTAYVDGVATTLTAKSEITATGTAGVPNIAKYVLTDGYLTSVEYIGSSSSYLKDTYYNHSIDYVIDGTAVIDGKEFSVDGTKAFTVATDGTVTACSVQVSPAGYDTYIVIGTAGDKPVVSYIYYIQQAE